VSESKLQATSFIPYT